MRFEVVAVGKLKERYWKEACAEYVKRLEAYGGCTVREVADVDPRAVGGVASAVEREGLQILSALDGKSARRPKGAGAPAAGASERCRVHAVLCAIEGRQRSSTELSRRLDALALGGTSTVAFIIGGSWGVSPAVAERADESVSFGAITLPHNLARVVLLEQLYRAQRISHGEPYHK